jgi:type IV pilus assembly protein PilO
MAFGLPQDQRSQVMLLIIVACLAGGYFLWDKVQTPLAAEVSTDQDSIVALNRVIEKAKADLAGGSVESMRLAAERYRGALDLMRQLVPEQNEVPRLLDAISTKAKDRGVTLGAFQPLTPIAGPTLRLAVRDSSDTTKAKRPPQPAFDIYRYKFQVYGHYDQIGEFLADVASLTRIMVPQGLVLKPASSQTQKLVGDTTGALLEADFDLRTYVKRAPATAPAAGGTGNARP